MLYCMIDNLVYGGAERQASYLFENNVGFEQLILLENYRDYNLKSTIPVYSIHSNILKIYQRPFGDWKSVKELNEKFNNTDTIVSFLERSNITNVKVSLKTGHKSIISVRNFLSERYKDKKYIYRRQLIKKYYPLADIIIVNSKESKQDLIKKFRVPEKKIKVIYNMIDIENINLLKEEQIEDDYKYIFDSPTILNIGSLIPQKSQKQLIEAFKEVKKKYPEYKLVIIGTGKLYDTLQKTIEELNLTSDVFLLGNTSNPFKYLNKADMFILNSKFEGFPNVLLEALTVGVPVVTKNCLSGPKEMLETLNYKNNEVKLTEYGYIFPRKSRYVTENREKEFLIEAMNKLIELNKYKPETYQKLKIKSMTRAKSFSISKIVNEWTELINQKN